MGINNNRSDFHRVIHKEMMYIKHLGPLGWLSHVRAQLMISVQVIVSGHEIKPCGGL